MDFVGLKLKSDGALIASFALPPHRSEFCVCSETRLLFLPCHVLTKYFIYNARSPTRQARSLCDNLSKDREAAATFCVSS